MTNSPRRLLLHILLVVVFAAAPLGTLLWPIAAGAQPPAPDSGPHEENLGASPSSLPQQLYDRGTLRQTGKGTPKLESSLRELSAEARLRGPSAALDLAARRSIPTHENQVRVVLELNKQQPEGKDKSLAAVRSALQRVGGREESSYGDLVSAQVPISSLEDIAADPAVRFVRTPLVSVPLTTTSEGVGVVNANVWHGAGLTGQNVKVAVVDGGFKDWQTRSAEGELPATVIARSFRSDGNIEGVPGSLHGTACAEIVYDMAPGAQLYLVNYGNEVELGNAVDWLIGEGVKVISYSMGWFNAGPGDGTGVINDIVARARSYGILWVSAAGNHAERHWEGTFSDTDGDGWHNFNSSEDEVNSVYLQAGQLFQAFLSWDDWEYSSQDYDLYLLRSDGQVVAGSANDQTGSQWPTEAIYYIPSQTGWYGLAIGRKSASRAVHFELYTAYTELEYKSPESSLLIPADSPNALAVGAVPYDKTVLEDFSSRGPTNGSTPRTKPDLVGPDGVSTITYGARGFTGTSASAPHVAGAAALAVEVYRTYTPAQIQAFLEGRAADLGAAGKDNLYGAGRVNLGTPPNPTLSVYPTSIEKMGEQSGAYLDPVTLQITNAGTDTLTWSATPNSPWLVVSPTSGTATAANPATATLTISTTALLPGIYDSSISWTASAGPPPSPVPVHLVLVPDGQLRRLYLPLVHKN